MLTPAMEHVIRRRETNFLNFHYIDSDSDNDSYAESLESEYVPVIQKSLQTGRSGTRIGLRSRPIVRRQSSDTDSSNSDSIEYVNAELVPTPRRLRAAAKAPIRNSKLTSRQFSTGKYLFFYFCII